MRDVHVVSRRLRQWGAVFLALGVLTLSGVVVQAQSSGGVGGRVANPDPENPRSKSIFIYTLERGESKQDQLLVVNPTNEAQTVTLGSVDGVVTNTGDYTCRQEVEPVEDSGAWVALSQKEVIVPAHGEVKVDFTITVPMAADVGEHNSCLTIQVKDSDAEDAGSGVRLRTRQAVRMVITIPGDLRRELSISNFLIEQKTATQVFTLTASNKGNVSSDIDMRVKVTSMLLDKEVANVGGEYPLVPSESLTKTFTSEIKPLFGGWYKVTPSIRFDKRLGAFGTQSQTAEYETITGDAKTMFLWPTPVGGLIIAGALALIAAFAWRMTGQAKRRRQLKNNANEYTVKKEDTIQTLAKKSKVSWQELAELNKIKAPYSLEVGQKILLPHVEVSHRRSRSAAKKR